MRQEDANHGGFARGLHASVRLPEERIFSLQDTLKIAYWDSL
jgi:hypothetical protein